MSCRIPFEFRLSNFWIYYLISKRYYRDARPGLVVLESLCYKFSRLLLSETEAAYFTQACSFVDIQAYFSINRNRVRLIYFRSYLFSIFLLPLIWRENLVPPTWVFPLKLKLSHWNCLPSNGAVSRDCVISIVVVRSNLVLSNAVLLWCTLVEKREMLFVIEEMIHFIGAHFPVCHLQKFKHLVTANAVLLALFLLIFAILLLVLLRNEKTVQIKCNVRGYTTIN